MNAFTSPSDTTYPFATQNRVDFYNLMDVYMDATLFPLLQETDFKQEGWRVGPEDPKDKSSPLIFMGVVYNEMKGQMSDSSYLYCVKHNDYILPSLHYSAGDPAMIPDLTVERLREFHKQHYHPSNAKVFTYGDMPLEEHLTKLNEKLSLFDRIDVDCELRVPITIDKPIDIKVPGPVDPLIERSQQFKTSLSWIMHDTSDIIEHFGVYTLSSLLTSGYGSPMYQGLVETKLGSDYSPTTGIDGTTRRPIFSVGLTRVKEEDVPKVAETVKEILRKCHKNGFDKQKIDGLLHQAEIALKHVGYP